MSKLRYCRRRKNIPCTVADNTLRMILDSSNSKLFGIDDRIRVLAKPKLSGDITPSFTYGFAHVIKKDDKDIRIALNNEKPISDSFMYSVELPENHVNKGFDKIRSILGFET